MSAYESVGNLKYVNLKDAKKGDVLVTGKYVESKPSKQYPSSLNHVFKSEEGPRVVISGGHLGWLLEEHCQPGESVQVVYNGQEKLTDGKFKGKMSHQFDLLKPLDDEAPVSVAPVVEQDTSAVDLSALD
jgi:hypothetical protein